MEQAEAALLAVIAERADDPLAILEQGEHRAFHVKVYALMNTMILERANHLKAGAVADVRQARVLVAAEVALQDAPVFGAIKERAPGFQLAHTVGRFARMQ